jgi:hypothetical protein
LSRGKRGGGQIEFINAAKSKLKAYGLHKDLDIYKALIKVFPDDGELRPTNMVQVIHKFTTKHLRFEERNMQFQYKLGSHWNCNKFLI